MTERPLAEAIGALLRPGGLQDQAEAALRRTLAADPHDTNALWKLAGTHRRKGSFAEARGLYRRLCVHGPGPRKAAWLLAVLGGNGPPEPAPGGVWPAPFVRMTNFLGAGECDRLLALGLAARERAHPARVGEPSSPRVDPEVRITLQVTDRATMAEARSRIVPKVRSLVPEVLARLRMDGIGRCAIQLSMRVYLTGGFYRPHFDASRTHGARVLSFVYFIHRQPPRFSGGDLLLHDTDADTGDGSCGDFSRIVPLRDSIVFFPSVCWHQVTPVQCETDDFGDGRWALNGHVLRRDRDEAGDG